MRGQELVIAARRKGFKPARFVMVDVGTRSNIPLMLGLNGTEKAPGVPCHNYVCLEPSESPRLADWSWCVGLKVQVDGDDLQRVQAAHDAVVKAGAARVVSSCVLSRDDVRVIESAEVAP